MEHGSIELTPLLWIAGWPVALAVLFLAGLRVPLQTRLAGLRSLLFNAGVVVAAVLVAVLASAALVLHDVHVNLTREKLYTPSTQALAVVDELARPVRLTYFYRGQDPAGRRARDVIEVMGRHSGYIALGACYGRPDILLVPEHPLNADALVARIRELYDLQKNVVILCGEGIVDENGQDLGAEINSTDPAGNKMLSGAAEALRSLLIARLGDDFFTSRRRNESARAAIFTRKVGHTQRGGRPILFDRFYAAQLGGNAVDMLLAKYGAPDAEEPETYADAYELLHRYGIGLFGAPS